MKAMSVTEKHLKGLRTKKDTLCAETREQGTALGKKKMLRAGMQEHSEHRNKPAFCFLLCKPPCQNRGCQEW